MHRAAVTGARCKIPAADARIPFRLLRGPEAVPVAQAQADPDAPLGAVDEEPEEAESQAADAEDRVVTANSPAK